MSTQTQFKQAIASCTKEIHRARQTQENGEIVAALGKRVMLYTTLQKWVKAAADLAEMAQIAASDNETAVQARSLYAQGKALGHVAAQYKTAVSALHQSAQLYRTIGNIALEAESTTHIARLHLSYEMYELALQISNDAIAQFLPTGKAIELVIELYQIQGTAFFMLMRFEQALMVLKTAVSLATQHNLPQKAAELRHQHHAIYTLHQGETNADALDGLLNAAQAAGTTHFAQDTTLQKAMLAVGNGRTTQGIQLAETVLDEARQATDLQRYVRYLLATLVIFQAEEAAGNRVGVLIALLRCKVFLETQLDKRMGQQIDAILNNMQTVWGTDGMQQAIAAYQEWVAANGPVLA